MLAYTYSSNDCSSVYYKYDRFSKRFVGCGITTTYKYDRCSKKYVAC